MKIIIFSKFYGNLKMVTEIFITFTHIVIVNKREGNKTFKF